MPSPATLRLLRSIPPIRSAVERLSRRYFPPLAKAPKTQGRLSEMRRLIARSLGYNNERLAIDANEWLMRTMARHCENPRITAVHAYEDCSLWQFKKAKRLGKACIYDMPIGYYAAWQSKEQELNRKYADWLPSWKANTRTQVSPGHKREEMELADLVFAPSQFVADTILEFHPDKTIAVAPYGLDDFAERDFAAHEARETITFLFVGQCSVRKGVPLLIQAWDEARLDQARLDLVGTWALAPERKKQLPPGCFWSGPVSRPQVQEYYENADVFVFPTNFEGRALAACEALGCGLPVLTTQESGISDLIDETCGRIAPADILEALIESLRWFSENRHNLQHLRKGASAKAKQSSWQMYRRQVTAVVQSYS
jgi:glycosyltransferase involved in cell wall biosynthesis